MPAACAVEFIHNFSLVHDDLPCMDNDDYRRGKPSCHRKFGEAKAVLAGDALLSTAFEILTDIKDPGSMKEAVAIISRASGLSGIMGGQGLDIMYINKKKSRDLAQRINALKTGALFIAAVKTGAALSGASAKRVKAVEKFGKIFGDSFQLRDDIIDKVYKGTASGIMKNKLSGMISGAKRTLDIFGKKADNLKKIADLLILEQDSEK
jgi:geranylgeranyl diphosphate synthase type II